MTESDEFLGSAAAAELLGINRRRFNRMVARHQIEPAITLGQNTAARLFRRSDVEALAATVVAA